MRRVFGSVAVFLTAMLAVSACGGEDPLAGGGTTTATTSGSPGGGKAIVGSFNFPESVLLGSIYAQALTAKGVKVEEKANIGSREVVYNQIKGGGLTVLPEYNGALLAYLDSKATAATTEEVNSALAAKLPPELTLLESSPAEDKDSLTVTKETAQKHSLTSIADLAKVAKDMAVGGPPEFKERRQKQFKDVYGLEFKEWKPTGAATADAIKEGTVQAGNVFTTDPKIIINQMVALEDPKNVFGAQNVTPLVNKSAQSDAITSTLNAVSAKLTTEGLTQMMQKISVNKDEEAVVAAEWLKQNGLL
ncbi:glycine/betaine ABC transporter substrate-binding protein [Spongiactinospora gelatinilytica]|uniref:Glycine/betaine ABC transporter substrate-binding protein n=1 Tax=Spongiactinospora gelatinilytica TaxID=2666298 RepID=A0A2W2FKT8_9ACTN|nr:ABC transporter substrate-binding protein [Spongiactinospora gelatinilytica]PZG30589.1 glycine/betaine ABC transporter substrate-binding protein [Spongiactinospora gelatinilytica]